MAEQMTGIRLSANKPMHFQNTAGLTFAGLFIGIPMAHRLSRQYRVPASWPPLQSKPPQNLLAQNTLAPCGLQRLRLCQCPDELSERLQTLLEQAQEITDLSGQCSEDAQNNIQLGLTRIAWMVVHKAEGGLQGEKLFELLDQLKDDLAYRQSPDDTLIQVHESMAAFVRQELTQKSLLAEQAPKDPYASNWNFHLSRMLLGPDGRIDATVLPFVKELLNSDDWSWLPKAHREDRILRLEQLLGDATLLDRVDTIAAAPVHAASQRSLELSDLHRVALAQHILITLLTPPLQGQLNNCWNVAANHQLFQEQPHQLLDGVAFWLATGLMRSYKPSGEVDEVAPDPYCENAVAWALRPCGTATELLRDSDKIVQALQRSLPAAGPDALMHTNLLNEVKAQFRQLQHEARGGKVLAGDVIKRVIAAHIGLPARHVADPRLPKGPVLNALSKQHEQLVADFMFAWESTNFSPIALALYTSFPAYAMREKLVMNCWGPIELALRASAATSQPPSGMRAHITQLRQVFLQNATLRIDPGESAGAAKFRLYLKVPGSDGRGVLVDNSQQLIEWLEHFSREAGDRGSASGSANARACHSCTVRAMHKPHFRKRVHPKSGKHGQHSVWKVEVEGFLSQGGTKVIPRKFGSQGALGVGPRPSNFINVFQVGNDTFEARGFNLRPGKSFFKTTPEQSLDRLVHRLRELNKGLLPIDFQQHLANKGGILTMAPFASWKEAHAFTLKPQHPLLQPAWNGSLSTAQWKQQTLMQPMRRLLKQRLNAEQAKTWLIEVLNTCPLEKGKDVDAAAAQVLKWASGSSAQPSDYSLQSLVSALDRLQASKTHNPFTKHKQRRPRELAIAVLNALPGGAPYVPYAHGNGVAAEHQAYWIDPFSHKIVHGLGSEMPGPGGQRSFRFDQVCDPLLL